MSRTTKAYVYEFDISCLPFTSPVLVITHNSLMGSICVVIQWQNHDPAASLYTPYGGILALSSLGMNKTAIRPNNLVTSNMSSINDLANIRSKFFFLKECSGRNNLTSAVFTWRSPSEVFPRGGRRQRYKPRRLKLYLSLLVQSEEHQRLKYHEGIPLFFDNQQRLNSEGFWYRTF